MKSLAFSHTNPSQQQLSTVACTSNMEGVSHLQVPSNEATPTVARIPADVMWGYSGQNDHHYDHPFQKTVLTTIDHQAFNKLMRSPEPSLDNSVNNENLVSNVQEVNVNSGQNTYNNEVNNFTTYEWSLTSTAAAITNLLPDDELDHACGLDMALCSASEVFDLGSDKLMNISSQTPASTIITGEAVFQPFQGEPGQSTLAEAKKNEEEKAVKATDSNVNADCVINQNGGSDNSSSETSNPGTSVAHPAHVKMQVDEESGTTWYWCTLCGEDRIFRSKAQIMYHQYCSEDDSVQTKPYKCQICGQCFVTKSHFDYHALHHSGQRPFKCVVATCGATFKTKADINRHARMHQNPEDRKRYQCPQCPLSFTANQSLKQHRRKHSGIRPHVCDVCRKTFDRKGQLDKHRRVHTGEKPFKCGQCPKSFNRKWTLTLHLHRHSLDRPFTCPHDNCTLQFATSRDLGRHFVNHGNDRPFVCGVPECGSAFKRADNLNRHVKLVHKRLN